MARVLGVGGIFFKAQDPKKLGAWYKRWLQVPFQASQGASFKLEGLPGGAFTVWSPFQASTSYFDPAQKDFMFNLVVDDLEEALSQVKQGGAQLIGEIEAYEFGRFGWFMDPEGNKVELWQP